VTRRAVDTGGNMQGLQALVLLGLLLVGDCGAQDRPLFPESSVRTARAVGEMDTTGQIVMQTRVETRSFNDSHTFSVSKSVEFFLKFEVPESQIAALEADPERHIFQVNVKSPEADEKFPVDLTIRQFRQMKTFQLPSVEREGNRVVYNSNERSVDFCPIASIDSNSTVLVSISTSSPSSVPVTIRVLIKGKNADWKRGKTDRGELMFWSKTTIKPVISRIRYFDTGLLDTDTIMVKVTTRNDTDCLCSLISIQKPSCPFYDDIGTATRHGLFSTMMDSGTVILRRSEYPDGFILVLVASAHENICKTDRCSERNANVTDPRKRVWIKIEPNGTDSDYAVATLTVIGLYLCIFELTITFSVLEFRYEYSDFEQVRVRVVEKLEQQIAVVKEGATNMIEELDKGMDQLKEQYIEPYVNQRKSSKGYSVGDGLQMMNGTPTNIALKKTEFLASPSDATDSLELDLEQGAGEDIEIDKSVENNFETPRESFAFIDKDDEDEMNRNSIIIPADERMPSFTTIVNAEKAKSESSFIASLEDLQAVAELDGMDTKQRLRMKSILYVTDLSQKLNDPSRTKSVYQKSQLYLGLLFIISIFYSLPVLQMVFRFSAEQSFTGNQDICYYNDLCRKPLGLVRDFNHVFSNLGYCVFGLLFMCIVLFKKLKFESFLEQNKGIQKEEYGVPCQYGLYFAMGLALSMEGVMSSSYHICPTNVTFQFDTTFMYLIAVLMFMKLYQVRHADVSANAIGVFFGLGVALLLETISIYYSGPWFWAVFCTVYIIVIVVVSVHAYNIGAVKYNWKILYVVAKILAVEVERVCCKHDCEDKSKSHQARPRLLCLLVIGLVNVAMCLFFGISGTPGASNYLLAIFFMNLTIYGIYYCAMKQINGEKINKIPLVYACLGLVCFVPSLYFFTKKEKSTESSPSISREMNQPCQFLDFFDGHDIWHFLGAAGVFFAFLCIFTLDEDVRNQRRDTIRVF